MCVTDWFEICAVRRKPPQEGYPFIDDYIAHSEQVCHHLILVCGV